MSFPLREHFITNTERGLSLYMFISNALLAVMLLLQPFPVLEFHFGAPFSLLNLASSLSPFQHLSLALVKVWVATVGPWSGRTDAELWNYIKPPAYGPWQCSLNENCFTAEAARSTGDNLFDNQGLIWRGWVKGHHSNCLAFWMFIYSAPSLFMYRGKCSDVRRVCVGKV